MISQFLEFFAAGVFLGAIYALLAVSMSLTWVTTDVIDIGTGAYAVVAAVIAAHLSLPYGPLVGIAAALGLGCVTGLIFLGFHLLGAQRDPMLIVLSTFAAMLAIESAVLTAVGTGSQYVTQVPGNLFISDILLSFQGIFNLVVSVVVMIVLGLLLRYTTLGLAMRASAVSEKAASLVGIAVRRTQFLTIMFSAGIAGVAGILAAMAVGISYSSTFVLTTVAFSGVVLLSRAGPIPAFGGAMILGILQSLADAYLPNGWAAAVPSTLIILVLTSSRASTAIFKGGRP